MPWWTELNHRAGRCELGAGSVEVLRWNYARHLPDNKLHRHPDCYELCLVGREGSGRFRAAGAEFRLLPGDLFLARPGVCRVPG